LPINIDYFDSFIPLVRLGINLTFERYIVPFKKENRANTFSGIMLIALFSLSAFYIADFPIIKSLSLSPLIIGIILGMGYANSLRNNLPETWVPGVVFSTKTLLRTGIIFFGFRLTYQNVINVGVDAIVIDLLVITSVVLLGIFLGKLLKIDDEIALLTATGSAICGAAAVLGAEPVVKSKPYKAAIAVSTVVIFGTISMFLYPVLYRSGILHLSPKLMGIYTGSSIHEVAHVVGAGNAMGSEIASTAVIVKMIRVILLSPYLLILSYFLSKKRKGSMPSGKTKITIPWFAIWFLVVIGFNSLNLLPSSVVQLINRLDTFVLTMAMTALGVETNFSKFKQAGIKPFVLGLLLFFWLIAGDYLFTTYIPQIL